MKIESQDFSFERAASRPSSLSGFNKHGKWFESTRSNIEQIMRGVPNASLMMIINDVRFSIYKNP